MRRLLLLALGLLLIASRVDAARRYVKTAGGAWSAAGTWSATGSGGVDSVGPPTAADDAILEAASGNLTVDQAAVARSLDAAGGTGPYTGTLTHAAGVTLSLGDAVSGPGMVALRLSAGMTLTVTATSVVAVVGTAATVQTITTAGKRLGALVLNAATGSWRLVDDLTTAGPVTLTTGTLDARGRQIDADSYVHNAGTVLFDGTSGVHLRRTTAGTAWTVRVNAVMATAPGGIWFEQAAVARTFAGGDRTYAALTLLGCVCSTDQVIVTGANTFTTLSLVAGMSNPSLLVLPSGVTTTVSTLAVTSTATAIPGIAASTPGMPALLAKATGAVLVDYLAVTDSTATGGAVWCAGAHSQDRGGNTGWTFADCAQAAAARQQQMTGVGR